MAKRKTKKECLEEARMLVENNGGKLISKEYINSKIGIDFQCACGNIYSLVLTKLRASKGFCPKCRYDRSISFKYNTDIVFKIFEEQGCILKSEYVSTTNPLEFICKCGRMGHRTLYSFLSKKECMLCTREKSIKKELLKEYEKVKNELEDYGCKLLSEPDDYTGKTCILTFICHCGEVSSKSCVSLRKKHQCNNCSSKDRINSSKTSFKEVLEYIESKGCELITKEEEYIKSSNLINIRCKCGEIYQTTFIYFKHENKIQCNSCGRKANSGENHRWWKGGTKLDSDNLRDSSDYHRWRRLVYERDNYECICCGSKKDLRVHHIRNFSEEENLRLDVDNGVTLCDDCHNPSKYGSFHYLYGTRNNNKCQLDEYIKKYKDGAYNCMRLANLIKPKEKISRSEKRRLLKDLIVFEILPLNNQD